MRGVLRATMALGVLASCGVQPPVPLPMPPADGKPIAMHYGAYDFQVTLQSLAQADGGIVMRVARTNGPALDYSDGKIAKTVAEGYCASRGRGLNPAAYGMFSAPGSWVFEGGCA